MKINWKIITLAIMYVAFGATALSSSAHATGNKPPKQNHTCQGGHNCNEDSRGGDTEIKIENEAEAEADARADADARSHSSSSSDSDSSGVGVGVGMGGSSDATGGTASAGVGNSGNSRNDLDATAEGGESNSRSDSRSGVVDSGNSGSSSGASVESADSYAVDASDNSSYSSSYNYEEAAKSAAILYGAVCSDVTNIQGVKFGIASSKQSTFCMRITLAQGFYSAASMLGCADAESIGKGAKYIRSPSASQCEIDQRRLYLKGTEQLSLAGELVDSKRAGWIHQLWNKVVW